MIADDGVAGAFGLEQPCQPGVQVAAPLLGDQRVGRLLQKRMHELLPARGGGLDQLAPRQVVELGRDRAANERLDRGFREVPAGDRGDAQHLALRLRQSFQACGQEHLDRARQPAGAVVVADHGRQVLGEERVALGNGDRRGRRRSAGSAGAGPLQQEARLGVVEALQGERDRVRAGTPSRPSVGELRPRGA